jgi:hypothetical protein
MLADNRLAEKAGWDRETLAIELDELHIALPEIVACLRKLPALLLDFIKQPHILAWLAKVDTSSICLSVNGRTSERDNVRTPIGMPSRNIGTPSRVRNPPNRCASAQVYSGSASTSGM